MKERTKLMLELRKKGLSYAEIGKIFKLSRQRIHMIIKAAIDKIKE